MMNADQLNGDPMSFRVMILSRDSGLVDTIRGQLADRFEAVAVVPECVSVAMATEHYQAAIVHLTGEMETKWATDLPQWRAVAEAMPLLAIAAADCPMTVYAAATRIACECLDLPLNSEQLQRSLEKRIAEFHQVVRRNHRNGSGLTRLTLEERRNQAERQIIEESLRRHNFRRTDTARELGISRVTLYNKMKKFGILN